MSELLTRGVANLIPKDLAEKKVKTEKKMRVYWGIDPTGGRIHLGHSIPMRKLQQFADEGHHAILLIGSFTAMIGDPSDRESERNALTREEVEKNFKTYKEQAAKVIDFDKVEVVYNHEWLEKITFEEILQLASNFTVQQMSERAMFKERMNKGNPVSVHEFLYPLMVGYDSVIQDVDCELGGTDQEFNMLAGRTLQKALGKREKFVLTTPLIEGTDGRKMSKSYDNCVYLDDEPSDMFGKMMSINDNLMETYFECCTDIPMDEVKKILKGDPREAKVHLAKEIVRMYHSEKDADAAESNFTKVFSEGGVPDDMPEVKAKKGSTVIDVLVEQGLIASKSEARRLVEQGGIKKDDTAIDSIDTKVEEGIYKVGKRKFLKISL
ncbi:tyrosine--tRNA ligase [bacterium]|nr:tyrosine--tRNA ligase [bacterium]|tara:strand:- start:356 stop:1498 length:1143 start_codon:yes stop_codon:yes gene_type:complete